MKPSPGSRKYQNPVKANTDRVVSLGRSAFQPLPWKKQDLKLL